ncbi:hypothetical protein [Abyssibacter profundi]|nr:hypothetical protein [Abyssibacter profundi]
MLDLLLISVLAVVLLSAIPHVLRMLPKLIAVLLLAAVAIAGCISVGIF